MKGVASIVVALFALSCCQGAAAHARSESYSTWQTSGDELTGVLTVASAEVTSLVDVGNTRPLPELLARHIEETVRVQSQAGDCLLATPTALQAARGFIRIELRFDCQGETPASLHYRALFDRLPAHVHYARIATGDGPPAEILFTDRANDGSLTHAESPSPRFTAFLDLGVRHILGGIDHIAFLLGMLLVSGTVVRGITAVTGFTVGHSLSLAAAVLGFVEADSRLVEAFIGFTVALLAVEYFLLSRPSAAQLAWLTLLAAWAVGALATTLDLISARAALAYLGFGIFSFCYLLAASRSPGPEPQAGRIGGGTLFAATACFGLIHGFGFAGFLMETGIRGASLLGPLLGFNLGVELGQLGLLFFAYLAFRLLSGRAQRQLAPVIAASLCGIGVFWFIGRSLAP